MLGTVTERAVNLKLSLMIIDSSIAERGDVGISVKSHRFFYPSSLPHSQGMASFSQEMWVGGINILQG